VHRFTLRRIRGSPFASYRRPFSRRLQYCLPRAGAAAVAGLSLTAPKGVTDYFFGVHASFQNFVAVFVLVVILVGFGLVFNNAPPPPLPVDLEDG
jgi:hypothetical protein